MNRHHRRKERLLHAIRRDIAFVFIGVFAYFIVAYVETRANDVEIRKGFFSRYFPNESGYVQLSCAGDDDDGAESKLQQQVVPEQCHSSFIRHSHSSYSKNGNESYISATGIIDAGFILTAPIHRYLDKHRPINDVLAMINSAFLILPLSYVVYSTLWKGDFRLSFRLIATHLFRSLCGWFTYLPPDPQFLMSYYDFPEIFLCLVQDCSKTRTAQEEGEEGLKAAVIVPFVTFFSGHIATILIIANHLYMRKHTRVSVCLHCFNWFQAIRLLATRGHYSIDLIIGYVVAVFVSSPAERLGLYYSWGILPTLPQNLIETFEVLVGVDATNSSKTKEDEMTSAGSPSRDDDDPHEVKSETSVRVIVEILSGFALAFLSSELSEQ